MTAQLAMGAPAPADDEAGGLPNFLTTEPAGRAWLQVFEHGSLYRGWHPADVEWALAAAHKTLRRVGGRTGPKGDTGFWPAVLQEEASQSTRRRLTTSEVSTMEAALGWAWDYLAAHDNERRAVQRWAFCKEYGFSYSKFLTEGGYARRTEQSRRQRGLTIIATALCRAETRLPREVLVARLERARSEVRGDAPDALAVAAQAGELPAENLEVLPPVDAPLPMLPPIETLWHDVELCALLAPEAQGPAVLSLLSEQARQEAACGVIASTGPALTARVAQLRAEAVARGVLARDARQGGALSREELTARIERAREQQNG